MAESVNNPFDEPSSNPTDGGPEIPEIPENEGPPPPEAEVPDVPDPMEDSQEEAAYPGGVPNDPISEPVPGGDPDVPTGGDPTINA